MENRCSRRRWAALVWLLLLTVPGTRWNAAAASKQVLILDSFGRDVAPFSFLTSAFRTTLAEELREPVDIYESSLDLARLNNPEMEAAQVDYLQHMAAARQFDLIVPVGSPAAKFALQHRDRISPGTPMVLVGVAERLVPNGTLGTNDTVVAYKPDLPGMVEDILRIAPDTTNIQLVFGISSLEEFWAKECEREFRQFTNRVTFTWLNDLSLDQMRHRVANLPPHSFILYAFLILDADGVPHDGYSGLQRLHAAANAPIYGYFQSELGLGAIGGRLFPDETVGKRAAGVAVRILRGANPADIPPLYVESPPPVYDWRELQRWHIDQARLPADSVVRFRGPTFWERYRWQIIMIVSLCLVEAMLILGLTANLVRRRRVEKALRQSVIARQRAEDDARESQAQLLAAVEIARLAYWDYDVVKDEFLFNDQFYALLRSSAESEGGYSMAFARYTQRFLHPDDVEMVRTEFQEAVASTDPDYRREFDHRVIYADGTTGFFALHIRLRKDAQGRTVRAYGANLDITDRKRVEAELTRSIREVIDLKTTLDNHTILATADLQGRITYVNDQFCAISRYSREELMGQDQRIVESGYHSQEFFRNLWTSLKASRVWQGDIRIRARDGSFHWLATTIVPFLDPQGNPRQYVAIGHNITERRQAEEAARTLSQRLIGALEEERARLGRELHDDLTQRLARLAIDAGRLERETHDAVTAETMRTVREELVKLSEDVHVLSHRLHPSLLEDLGLPEALKAECGRFSRQTGVPVSVQLPDLPSAVPRDVALCLFRIAQGALGNVARHARAGRVEVSLRTLDSGLQLAVRDDGVGFDPALPRKSPGLGLASMRERAHLVNGELDTDSAPGQGTTVVAWVPVKKKAEG